MKDLNPITDIDVMEKYIKSEMGYNIDRKDAKLAVKQLNELVGEQQARQKIIEMNNSMNRKVVKSTKSQSPPKPNIVL